MSSPVATVKHEGEPPQSLCNQALPALTPGRCSLPPLTLGVLAHPLLSCIWGSQKPPCATLTQYVEHFHHELNHQGKGNVLLFPTVRADSNCQGPIQCRERLGGLLKYYTWKAA